MSFTEKIAGLMARPGQDSVPRDDIPWYFKYGARILGIVAAFFCILFGFYACISFSATCIIFGIVEMLIGFLVMVIEAPCCCMFIDYVQQIAEKADQRPYWNRGALYCGLAIIPVIFCPGVSTFFGCGLVFGTGVLYGMMALGKKATAEEMRNAAAIQSGLSAGSKPPTTNDRASIVNNAQPFSFTGAVATDSNV